MVTTAILADGAPPTHPAARAAFDAASRLVCCDGAYRKARALGRLPDLVVGDGDSLSAADRAALGERFVSIAEQETNDLDKAFRTAVARFGGAGIVILGAGGLREDHFLGNVFRLPGFARAAPDVAMVTDAGTFTVVTGARRYACRPGEAVSVFAPDPAARATSEGLEWPLDGASLAELWRGTLNRTTGTSFRLACDRPLLVYRPFPSPPGNEPVVV
ncbi:MAG: thiamine diphosphokinase [bacterium]|nr:thiamine diphosphokinase [bacterium]